MTMSTKPDKGHPNEYLTIRQIAEMLSISTASAWGLVARRELPHLRVSARLVRVRRADLVAYIERHTQEAG